MIYTIILSNAGDKATDTIRIKFSNIDSLHITDTKWGALAPYPCLWWEPLTFKKPDFENETLKIEPLPPSSTLTLTTLILFGADKKRTILFSDIPYIETIGHGDKAAERFNELPFAEGSIKALQKKLNEDLKLIVKELKELSIIDD